MGKAPKASWAIWKSQKTDFAKQILTVDNPETVLQQALSQGAKEVYPVGEAYGWRMGRLTDPFGMDWEIGKEL